LVLEDKLIDEVSHCGVFGETSTVQKSILAKVDKVMTAHLTKANQGLQTGD
jgi:hypothetical protein